MRSEEEREKVSSKKGDSNSIKELTVAPTLTALLKPTAEYLGSELRDYVKSLVEEMKEKKREQNLKAHLQAVQEQLENDPRPIYGSSTSFSQLELFDEWIDRAQEIDPMDTELSELWQSLLTRAAKGDRIPSEVVLALKTLSPMEAQFLFEMNNREPSVIFTLGIDGDENRYLANSLEAKRILEKSYVSAILIFSALSIFLVYGFYSLKYEFSKFLGDTPVISVAIAFAVIAIAVIVFSIRGTRWKLTWLGDELMRFTSRAEVFRRRTSK